MHCRLCRRNSSIRTDSLFDNFQLPIVLIFRVLCDYFLERKTMAQAIFDTGKSLKTISLIYKVAR